MSELSELIAAPVRVALYGRVSTRDKGQDTENQMVQLRQFALAMKYTVVGEYVDHVSASGKKDRDQFRALFEDAHRRKFDLVLFWSLDRFSREGVRETLNHLNRLTEWGVNWRSYTEQYLDSTGIFREAVIAILAAVAKQERIRISERTLAGLNTARRKGKILGRRPVACDMEELQQLRESGMSIRKIAAETGLQRTTVYKRLMRLELKAGGEA